MKFLLHSFISFCIQSVFLSILCPFSFYSPFYVSRSKLPKFISIRHHFNCSIFVYTDIYKVLAYVSNLILVRIHVVFNLHFICLSLSLFLSSITFVWGHILCVSFSLFTLCFFLSFFLFLSLFFFAFFSFPFLILTPLQSALRLLYFLVFLSSIFVAQVGFNSTKQFSASKNRKIFN